MDDNDDLNSISAYIGLECASKNEQPTICIEFDINLNLFIFVLALSNLEKCNNLCESNEEA